MEYKFAQLSEDQVVEIKKLENQLGVSLIAYIKEKNS
jgi:hypothetical protein